ncbi:MAG: hypothetical protein OEY11_09500 [Gammaproteobacteria bacterium]|nr:hypothetical protein [Gammaproteobacteria bacterium]
MLYKSKNYFFILIALCVINTAAIAEDLFVEDRSFGYMSLRLGTFIQNVNGSEVLNNSLESEYGIKPFRSSGLSARVGFGIVDVVDPNYPSAYTDGELIFYYGLGYSYLIGNPNNGRWYLQYNYDLYPDGGYTTTCYYICGTKTSYGLGYVGTTWHLLYELEEVENNTHGRSGFSFTLTSGGWYYKSSTLGKDTISSFGFLLNY